LTSIEDRIPFNAVVEDDMHVSNTDPEEIAIAAKPTAEIRDPLRVISHF
jgi:hypothetical protein